MTPLTTPTAIGPLWIQVLVLLVLIVVPVLGIAGVAREAKRRPWS